MSIFSSWFGGKSAPKTEPVSYEGFQITPDPIPEGSRYRVCAAIEKEVVGETKTHQLVRADVLESYEMAVEVSTSKARQMIDEQGDKIFG